MSLQRSLHGLGLAFAVAISVPCWGQVSRSGRHPFQRSDSPPGVVGTQRILGAGHMVAQYQAIRFEGPGGCRFALANGMGFQPTEKGPVSAAVMIGPAYRFKITDIPDQPGIELFPTVEVIDRLCPPPGLEASFPIPIILSIEDLEAASLGNMVTRVIYLEDPQTALPVADKPGSQRHFDVGGSDDPLHVADELGKPMAIVRIGSRVAPDRAEQMNEFLLGSPPWIPITLAQPTAGNPGMELQGEPHNPQVKKSTRSTASPPVRAAGIPQSFDSPTLRR